MGVFQKKCLFPGQQDNEKILLVTRQHWAILLMQVGIWLLFALLPILFDVATASTFPGLREAPGLTVVNTVKTVYLMLLCGALFTIWIIYYLNFQVVTDHRIVDITQKSVLYHVTSELNLSRVQDVTAEVRGILGTLLNYGNVYVQTAGETVRFEFVNVPQPHRVAKLILDFYEQLPRDTREENQ